MKDSNHLKDICETKRGSINLQVVFSDTVAYSQRKSTVQKKVIENFTKLNQDTLNNLSINYSDYAQENSVSIYNDIIKIPTGDGLAVIFPFQGLQSIHLDFAIMLLEEVHKHNIENDCKFFKENGWCNCHDNFNLRIGLSEGKGIIYKDLNGNYNVAGNVINMASRVMSLGDNNSIILTEEAYKYVTDMTEDTILEKNFKLYKDIEIKHGVKLNIYQYCPEYAYINNKPSKNLIKRYKQINTPRTPITEINENLQYSDVEFAVCCLLQQIVKAKFLEVDEAGIRYDGKSNLILGINRGGAILGGMLAKSLMLPPRTLVLLYDLPPGRYSSDTTSKLAYRCLKNLDFTNVKKILLVDDTMRTGDTMKCAERMLVDILNEKEMSEKIEYKKLCILYQKQIAHGGAEYELDFFVYRTELSEIRLPWDKMHLFEEMKLDKDRREEFEELCRSMKH
jgi:hypoxanthine phosphoribosyltransferase